MLRLEKNKMYVLKILKHIIIVLNSRVLIMPVVHVTYTMDFIRIDFQYRQCMYQNTHGQI